MPLVPQAVPDMIGAFAAFTDVLILPTNSQGSMGAGLAKAFADRWPDMHTAYLTNCQEGKLPVGSLFVHDEVASKNIIITMQTKQHWADPSDDAALTVCCQKLTDYLKARPMLTVAMPLLGVGQNVIDPQAPAPDFMRPLDALPNIIHLSIRPDRFIKPPLYLGVVGSRAFTDYNRVDLGVGDALIEFGMTYADFNGMVSGGATGVDSIACGRGIDDPNPNLATSHGLRPIVCQADWKRYGDSAGFVRNRTVENILTHVVAFVGKKSIGTRGLLALVNRHNAHVDKLRESQLFPTNGDFFSSSPPPLPEKKPIFIHDISSVSI